jgi:pyruvate-ferredoxin/flavodoxin oxidoreductase
MAEKNMVIVDGNAAVAHVAHATNEVIAIYPITPSSPMGELSDEFSAKGRKNIWGTVPHVIEMQSEAGAAGAVHGALSTGAMTTTFTASQGLLLMIPNMFKIAGELTPTVFHIAARAIAAQGLSIFGDHSDVMSARSTGWAMLASNSVQEAMDMALISQAATLESRVPFLHFFDGFRTSHEVQKIEEIPYEIIRKMIKDQFVHAHRSRALDPEHPSIKGTSQNPDVYFSSRETVNKYYNATPAIVQKVMDEFATLTGRAYKLFDYVGAPDADRVMILMGSGADTMEETIEYLTKKGEKVGLLKVRLFRPFSAEALVKALPKTVKKIAVLDRTKEPGSLGEPLYEDVQTAITELNALGTLPLETVPMVVGGRYGLGSCEFVPSMGIAILDNLKQAKPKNKFTVGIYDDVTNSSLSWDESLSVEGDDVFRGLFFGLGSDGTVGANKNSIKIIGTATDNRAQGYFVYDSKKAGTVTVSHVRFGKKPIHSAYLISDANFVACHKFAFLEKVEMLKMAKKGATFLLASPFGADKVWDELPAEVQKQIIDKELKFFVIDALKIASDLGMGSRINVIMQTAFFKISGVLPADQAVNMIKEAIIKTYSNKGKDIVDSNLKTVDASLEATVEVKYPKKVTSKKHMKEMVPEHAPTFVKEVIGEIMSARGDKLPVSVLPDDGTFPVATTKYEKRNIADMIPVWDETTCIQCGDCSAVCPHATIRMKVYEPNLLEKAPAGFKSTEARGKEFQGMKFTLQVAPEDCTGCGVCVNVCPAFAKDAQGNKTQLKAINMAPQVPLRDQEVANWDFFLNTIPNIERDKVNMGTTKGSQLLEPLFEFSGACAGCGETPYVKLLSQFFGDRAVIANATGCSSIYGGNLPTTPYTTRKDGRGPAWSNSLFEDAAEFGFGFRLTADKMLEYGKEVLAAVLAEGKNDVKPALVQAIIDNTQETETLIEQQRKNVAQLKKELEKSKSVFAKELLSIADYLIKKSVWILGGDGWAYDIGFGGLDHVIASGKNVNILVMDTEVYSNTGGQMSKATPTGAIAKFAYGGKAIKKKDLGSMAMTYGYVYVAKIAMGYNRIQTLKAFQEAEAYDGPSIIIAYSHCVAHGLKDMAEGMTVQKNIVNAGLFPLYRYNPMLAKEGKNPFILDSKEPTFSVEEYLYNQIRFRSLKASQPEAAAKFLEQAKKDVEMEYKQLKYLAERPF